MVKGADRDVVEGAMALGLTRSMLGAEVRERSVICIVDCFRSSAGRSEKCDGDRGGCRVWMLESFETAV